MNRQKVIIAAAASVLILFTLLLPPFFGKADDGSFYNLLTSNSLYNLEGADAAHFNPVFGISPRSEGEAFLPVTLAKLLGGVFSKTFFDIRFLALVYLPVFITGMFLVIGSINIKDKLLQTVMCIFTALILCDIGYISYFNSFYTDALFICSITLMSGALMYMLSHKKLSAFCLAAVFAGAVILAAQGTEGLIFSIAAAITLCRCIFFDAGAVKRIATLCTVLLIAVLGVTLCGMSPGYENESLCAYNRVFEGVLKDSPSPEADLEALGIPAKYAQLSGKTYYEARDIIDLDGKEFEDEFLKNAGTGKIVSFYLSHPARFYSVLDNAAKNAPFSTQSYIAVKQSGAYGLKAAPSVWSFLRRFLSSSSILALLVLSLAIIAVSIKNFKKIPSFSDAALFLLAGAAIFFITPVFSGGLASVSRRLVLHQLTADLLTVALAVWIINTLLARREQLRKKYGVNQ